MTPSNSSTPLDARFKANLRVSPFHWLHLRVHFRQPGPTSPSTLCRPGRDGHLPSNLHAIADRRAGADLREHHCIRNEFRIRGRCGATRFHSPKVCMAAHCRKLGSVVGSFFGYRSRIRRRRAGSVDDTPDAIRAVACIRLGDVGFIETCEVE